MPLRLPKILLAALIGLWIALVAFGNLTDYDSNWAFVRHVLAMDTVFPGAGIHYRAIHAPWLQRLAYAAIIAAETLAAALCLMGAWRMWRARRLPASLFRRSAHYAVAGIAAGLVVWLGGFMAIGGEWFGMWMSTQWNGLESACHFVVVLLATLVLLAQRDDEAGQ